jgi:hypothetical protein
MAKAIARKEVILSLSEKEAEALMEFIDYNKYNDPDITEKLSEITQALFDVLRN